MDKLKLSSILNETIKHASPLSGGCIANTQKIITESGKTYAVKIAGQKHMFHCEANGLKELEKAKAIRIPSVFFVDDNCLILEFINEGSRNTAFFGELGAAIAKMHQYTSSNYGFFENNFIGATPQINIPSEYEATNWCDFYLNKRLLFQFKLAEKNGYVDVNFRNLFIKLEKKLPFILEGSEEPPTLIHGDLWSGNYMVDDKGGPVLIDPAVYYGHREAELAMTKLFGGFSSDFYNAYNKAYPLKEGYEFRERVYALYHVLNHLNLFGTGYLSQAISLMEDYVGLD